MSHNPKRCLVHGYHSTRTCLKCHEAAELARLKYKRELEERNDPRAYRSWKLRRFR